MGRVAVLSCGASALPVTRPWGALRCGVLALPYWPWCRGVGWVCYGVGGADELVRGIGGKCVVHARGLSTVVDEVVGELGD